MSTAIRERLTEQFSQRYDEKAAIEAGLQAIDDATPLPGNDLSLIDELPHAPGMIMAAADDLRERLATAFDLQAIYQPDTRQATIILTITDTTPATIAAILEDPASTTTPPPARTHPQTCRTPPERGECPFHLIKARHRTQDQLKLNGIAP